MVGNTFLPTFGHLEFYAMNLVAENISTRSCQFHIFSHCYASNYVYHFWIQGTTQKSDGLSNPREIKESCGGDGYIWKGLFLNASCRLCPVLKGISAIMQSICEIFSHLAKVKDSLCIFIISLKSKYYFSIL